MMRIRSPAASTRVSFAAIAVLLLSGCAQDPDLGRYRPNVFDRVQAIFAGEQGVDTQLPLTDAEVGLRQLAANLMSERPVPDDDYLSRLENLNRTEASASASLAYYLRLRARYPTSLAALANALSDDVMSDTTLMGQFTAICSEINAADQARADSLHGAPTSTTTIALDDPASFVNLHPRLEQNGYLIDTTADVLARRLVSYRTALAHMRIDAPQMDEFAGVTAAIRRMDEALATLEREAVRHQAIEAFASGRPPI
ncbi:MAG: hypothetical protein WA943_02300 [Parvibaculum sp.]|uniref:hypothetical protein n=1 Tax=Parvibaculum sp. TaxID=2024848 RepID=UPI003C735BC1